jgi:methionyl-tRNA synthetase
MPEVARAVERFLAIEPLEWSDAGTLLLDHKINPYQHLMTRVDPKQLDALFAAVKDNAKVTAPDLKTNVAKPAPNAPAAASAAPPGAAPGSAAPASSEGAQISIDDFKKVDLRVARIADAEHVEGADKLLKLTLDLGTETRTVFSGIKSAYDPQKLKGRLTVMVANLAPRKMKFGISQGMVLAASGDDGPGVYLLEPDSGATPGMKVT